MKQWMININLYLKKHNKLTKVLAVLLKIATYWFYINFIWQLILLTKENIVYALYLLIYSAIGFILLTIIRDKLNKPRPYEVMNITPVINKNTKGHSFPSRHVFSCILIMFNWLLVYYWLTNNIYLILFNISILFSLIIIITRIIFTIHYPIDTIIATLSAWLWYLLNYLIIIHVIH